MFKDFLFVLRERGLKVSLTEWLTLIRAMAEGHSRADLSHFYHLARALLVKRETQYDLYDQIFAAHFRGVETHFDISDELLDWLSDPVLPRQLSEEELAALKALDLDELRSEFEKVHLVYLWAQVKKHIWCHSSTRIHPITERSCQ